MDNIEVSTNNSDLRKILDELHTNRVSIENDRKSYEKVRNDVLAAGETVKKLSDQLTVKQTKDKELGDVIALRRTDINLLKIKSHILASNCERMEGVVEEKRNHLTLVKQEFHATTSHILQISRAFSKHWNCSQEGKRYRQSLADERILVLQNFQGNLEYELDDFLLIQRNLDRAETEKNEMEERYKKSVVSLKLKENNLHAQLKEAENVLSNLYKERKVLAEAPGAARLADQMDKIRESVAYWDNRVVETQAVLRNQRAKYY